MKTYMTKRCTKKTLQVNELHLSCVLSLTCIFCASTAIMVATATWYSRYTAKPVKQSAIKKPPTGGLFKTNRVQQIGITCAFLAVSCHQASYRQCHASFSACHHLSFFPSFSPFVCIASTNGSSPEFGFQNPR